MIYRHRPNGEIDSVPLEERFWNKVKEGPGCWEWQGYKFSNGYGGIKSHQGKRMLLAHRVSYAIAYGEIPEGKLVCHKCDNTKCVRPDHLFLGTQADNLLDMRRKGRSGDRRVYGEKNGSAKLTSNQVLEIRKRYLAGGITQKALAGEYGVSLPLIEKIIGGRLWKQRDAGYGLLGAARDWEGVE